MNASTVHSTHHLPIPPPPKKKRPKTDNPPHSCRAAQDAVRLFKEPDDDDDDVKRQPCGPGLALVLNHCNVDSRNPYLREWALLAVRHLCAGNEENQRAIAALSPQAAVPSEGLRAMGVEARLVEGGRVAVRRAVGGGGGLKGSEVEETEKGKEEGGCGR